MQGSVRDISDNLGNPVNHIIYTAYGQISSIANPSGPLTRMLYTGYVYDSDTGLYYANHRYYDPQQHRFTSMDPMGFNAGDTNLYRYVANNPLGATDPSGEASEADTMLYFGAIFKKQGMDFYDMVKGAGVSIQFVDEPLDGQPFAVEKQTLKINRFNWRYASDDSAWNIFKKSLPFGPDSFAKKGELDPASQAASLFSGLLHVLTNPPCRSVHDAFTDYTHNFIVYGNVSGGMTPGQQDAAITHYLAMRQNEFNLAAGKVAVLAESYIRGVAMLNWGSNLAMSLGDILDGHYMEAAINLFGPAMLELAVKTAIQSAMKAARLMGNLKIVCRINGTLRELLPSSELVQKLLQYGCFAPGTLVSTEYGQRPIETIKAGERVWACDVSTQQWSLQTVTSPYTLEFTGAFVKVATDGSEFTCTDTHPFWVVEGKLLVQRPAPIHIPTHEQISNMAGRWVAAIYLQVGDVLLRRNGDKAVVDAVSIRAATGPVHNLTVANAHSYAIASAEILAHNTEEPCKRAEEEAGLIGKPVGQQNTEDLENAIRDIENEQVQTEQQADGVIIELKRPSGVTDEQWQAKLDALNKGAADGRAKVVYDPIRTGVAQREARESGMINPGDDADHGLDLQFGGDDTLDEIQSTNSRVNRSVGSQGRVRLDYPDGTTIKGFVEKK